MTYKPLSSGKITPERSTKYDARKIMGVRGRLGGGAFFITMEDANKMTRSLFTLRLRIHLSTKLTLQKKKMKKNNMRKIYILLNILCNKKLTLEKFLGVKNIGQYSFV